MKKVRWDGEGRAYEADEARNTSINLEPGEELEVSDECHDRLVEVDGWSSAEDEADYEPETEGAEVGAPRRSRKRK